MIRKKKSDHREMHSILQECSLTNLNKSDHNHTITLILKIEKCMHRFAYISSAIMHLLYTYR